MRALQQRSVSEPSMRSRFAALASGSQPAIVKLVSFSGGGRLGAMVNYVSRNGEVTVENERSEELHGRNELSDARSEWDHLMKNRSESRDIGTFSMEVKEVFGTTADLHDRALILLKKGLGDRSFVFAATSNDDGRGYRVEGVTVLRDSAAERLTGDRKASEIVQGRIDDKSGEQEWAMTFRFNGYGNGTDYGANRVRDLIGGHLGAIRDDKGRVISVEKQATDLVQLEWRKQLHSRKPRDVMHVVISARAGTDVEAFRAAARDFLAQEFAGHRYLVSLHDPSRDPKAEAAGGKRPHVHVHAIIAMRSDAGDRVETTIASFRRWRVTMAEKARLHGIRMEMTDRRERASAPAYSRNQVRPTSRAGRTQHEGTSPGAQRRYDAKRADHLSIASTQDSKIYSLAARQEWLSLERNSDEPDAKNFAYAQAKRLKSDNSRSFGRDADSSESEGSRSQHRINLVKLTKIVTEGDVMRHMTRQEFEAYEKRVEAALFQAERIMSEAQKQSFEDIASAAREHVNVRRELMELQEQGAQADRDPVRSAREEDDNPNAQWEEVVGRHGLRTAEAANRAMLEVERYREEIVKASAGEITADKAALQADLQREIAKAAELGAAGNTLIREIAEVDEALRVAIERAEQCRSGRNKSKPAGAGFVRSRANDGENRRTEEDVSRRLSGPEDARAAADADRPRQEQARSGDTTRTDPARQHSPRLEQLQREADERRDEEREERER